MVNQPEFCVICDRSENRHLRHSRLFRFPADGLLKDKWLSSLNITKTDLRCRSRVCAGHFTRDQFVRYRLKKGAIPTILVPSPPPRILQSCDSKVNIQPTTAVVTPAIILQSSPPPLIICSPNQTLKVDKCIQSETKEATEAEVALKKELATCKQEVYRLKKLNMSLRNKLNNAVDINNVFSKNPLFENVIMSQVSRYKDSSNSPYTEFERSLSMALHYSCGMTGYRTLLKLGFKLPAVSTLKRWLSGLKFYPGLNDSVLERIRLATANLSDKDKDCVLMWDEMAIKEYLEYNKSDDMLEGIVDLGSIGRDLEIANEVLVFMVCGIHLPWKFPVSFYFSKNATKSDHLDLLVKENISTLTTIGLKVRLGVCDMGFTNQGLYRKWKVTEDSPFIEFNGCKIYMIHDTPHLLKLVRNNLMKHSFVRSRLENGNPVSDTIKWSYIRNFYNLDRQFLSRLAPKSTKAHINVKDFSKMKVKLAAQIFSQSVYAGMTCLVQLYKMPPEAQATADFVLKVDEIYDFLNTSAYVRDKPTRVAKNFFQRISKFNEYIDFFKSVKLSATRKPEFIRGFILTLSGIKLLSLDLLNEGYSHLYTRRLQQDPLENMFSAVRMKGGNCRIPSAIQFRRNLRFLFVSRLMVISGGSNCELSGYDDFSVRVANMEKAFSVNNLGYLDYDSEDDLSEFSYNSAVSDFFSIDTNNSALHADQQEDLVSFYLGGYSVKAVIEKNNCSNCSSCLLAGKGEMKQDLLAQLKDYNECLTYISEYCFNFFKKVNTLFATVLVESVNVSGTDIALRIIARYTQEDIVRDWIDPCNEECIIHRSEMLHHFIKAKIFRIVKDKNENIKQVKCWDQKRRDMRHE